jgi:hypothetical protein
MRLKWKLDSVHLEIMLILRQDWCMICAERTTGSEIILDAPDKTPRSLVTWVVWNLILVRLETVLVSVQR